MFGNCDCVGAAAELGGVRSIVPGIGRVEVRQPVGDRCRDRLGDIEVVEDVFVGRVVVAHGAEQRVGIDRLDTRMAGQHLVDPRVVPAAVVNHQLRVDDRGGVRGAGLVRMRVGMGAGEDGFDGYMPAGDRACHAAPHIPFPFARPARPPDHRNDNHFQYNLVAAEDRAPWKTTGVVVGMDGGFHGCPVSSSLFSAVTPWAGIGSPHGSWCH